MPLVLSYATALLLGSLHALEADHMAAVTSFAVRKPGRRDAVRFAIRWAIGHGGAILVIGTVLVLAGIHMQESVATWLERLVGVVMVGLGIWTFRGARSLHVHRHRHDDGTEHEHLHSHAHAPSHDHGHAVTAVGLAHGLAGSGSAVALIPVVGFETAGPAILYLLLFALGTVGGMAAYGLFAGTVAGRTAQSSERMAQLLVRVTGVFTVVIGFVWIFR